ncbi:MAG: hypothetical protein U0R78_15435 [Nocardioidaceae bacterium]
MTDLPMGAPARRSDLVVQQQRLTTAPPRSSPSDCARRPPGRASRQQQRNEHAIVQVNAALDELTAGSRCCPTRSPSSAERLAAARHQAATGIEAARASVEDPRRTPRVRSREVVWAATVLVVEARDHQREAIDLVHARKETRLAIREQAAYRHGRREFARDLAVGDDCPVCGSADHPHPAEFRPGAPRRRRREAPPAPMSTTPRPPWSPTTSGFVICTTCSPSPRSAAGRAGSVS